MNDPLDYNYSNPSDYVTILVEGATGAGKSALGNAFLNIEGAFEESSDPDSCTFRTSSQSNIINGKKRYFIDTQGLNSSDGLDAEYIQQMVQFLKEWKLGVNAFFIVINIQNPRFDRDVQKMLMLMNDFFNNPDFWIQTGIIFTKCFQGKFNREVTEVKYRQKVIDFIKKMSGCHDLDLQMPCFFVDSPEFKTEDATQFELLRIFEFAHKNKPVPTTKLVPVRPDYKSKEKEELPRQLIKTQMEGEGGDRKLVYYYEDQIRYKVTDWNGVVSYTLPETIRQWTESESMPEGDKSREEEILERVLVKTELVGEGLDLKRINHYEDQRRFKITGWDDSISYSEPETIRSYTEEIPTTVEEDTKIEQSSQTNEKFKMVKTSKREILGFLGPRIKKPEHDYYQTDITNVEYKRSIITDPDGNISFTDWEENDKWTETKIH